MFRVQRPANWEEYNSVTSGFYHNDPVLRGQPDVSTIFLIVVANG